MLMLVSSRITLKILKIDKTLSLYYLHVFEYKGPDLCILFILSK